jgi:quercetin dioxygenase-like cupin family protein
MLIGTLRNRALEPVAADSALDVSMQWLIDKSRGAPNFAMRLFRIEPGGHTPRHTHNWEHEVFVVRGNGRIWAEGKWNDLEQGAFVLVAPNEEHQFEATPGQSFEFLCLVPNDSY